jgi:hypothetical protein
MVPAADPTALGVERRDARRDRRPPPGLVLAPIGVADAPATLGEALALYLRARASAIDALGVLVDPEPGRQVSRALRRHRVIT